MQENDANAGTIGSYLQALLRGLWRSGEGFSGKRPFGNSGWDIDLYKALGECGLIAIEYDEDGDLMDYDGYTGRTIIFRLIDNLYCPDKEIL